MGALRPLGQKWLGASLAVWAAITTYGADLASSEQPHAQLLQAQGEPQEEPQNEADPAPRRVVAGLQCVVAKTTVTFHSQPNRPHTVEWILAFPQRSRLTIAAADETDGRRLIYEFGSRLWEVGVSSGKSTSLAPDTAQSLALEFALRRAFWAWPGEGEWTKTESSWSLELASLGDRGSSGSLRAEDFEGELPTTLRSLDVDGAEQHALRDIHWEERDGRLWPVRASLHVAGREVWSERLEEVSTRRRYLDATFQPADRRPAGRDQGTLIVSPREVLLPPTWTQTRPLRPGEDAWTWAGTFAEQRGLAQSLEGSGWTLEPVPDLLLDGDGQPSGLRWTASGGPGRDSDPIMRAHGWLPRDPTMGVVCSLMRLEELHPRVWGATQRQAFGRGKQLPGAYLRRVLDSNGAVRPLELIQPLGLE